MVRGANERRTCLFAFHLNSEVLADPRVSTCFSARDQFRVPVQRNMAGATTDRQLQRQTARSRPRPKPVHRWRQVVSGGPDSDSA